MVVLLTFKNEEDQIKNEGARVLTRLYINFSEAQGQVTAVCGGISAEIQTHPSFYHYGCPRYLQV